MGRGDGGVRQQALFVDSSGVPAGGRFRKEINSLADLEGLKFRIAGLGGEVLRRLGATPVLTPPAEVFPAMAAGPVDAAEFVGPWNDPHAADARRDAGSDLRPPA